MSCENARRAGGLCGARRPQKTIVKNAEGVGEMAEVRTQAAE
jgi:hypothetical protein